jgi:membrane protease YdiL (CAAX protease family)
MSAEWAVLLSSVAFGAAHLSARDFPQLTALGIVMGFSYVRSRNLMTPILIHGTWNGVVLSLLFILSANGYDLTDIPSW